MWKPCRRDVLVVATFLAIAAGVSLQALPAVLARWVLSPDVVGYVATANDWLSGAGWVEPVVYSYMLEDFSPPAPALAVRPPILSVLLIPPLALGAGFTTLAIVHVLWASLVGASAFLVGRRHLSTPTAAAFAIATSWSMAYVAAAQQLLTEATAVGVTLLALAWAPLALRSASGGVIAALITWLGWLARANLGVILPAVLLAALWELGPRAAVRSRALWTYVGCFGLLWLAVGAAAHAAWGISPYAHYAVMTEILNPLEASSFQKESVGWTTFVLQHREEIRAAIESNLRSYWAFLFLRPTYLHIGWLVIPALVYGLWPRGDAFELRFAVFAGLGLTASTLLVYGGMDPLRYPLPGVVCLAFVGMRMLDTTVEWATGRFGARWPPIGTWLARTTPLLLVLSVFFLGSLPESAGWIRRYCASYRRVGTLHPGNVAVNSAQAEWGGTARWFCRLIHPDAVVAAPDPWTVALYCGNAAYWLPYDLTSQRLLHRYLDERMPHYVISDGSAWFGSLAGSHRLEHVVTEGRFTLYRLRPAPSGPFPWRAPPPLATLGGEETRGEASPAAPRSRHPYPPHPAVLRIVSPDGDRGW